MRRARVRSFYGLVALLCALAATCLLAASTALAAAPETPEVKVVSITGTEATFEGVLNPDASTPVEAGYYDFYYKRSGRECEGNGEGIYRPSGVALGLPHEQVPAERITGLQPGTAYTVCLSDGNAEGGATSIPLTFKTATSAPSVGAEASSAVSATAAVARAQIDPGGLATDYYVEYASAAQIEAHGWAEAARAPAADAELPASGEPLSVNEPLSGLIPETAYRFRFVASNTASQVLGAEATFTTAANSAVGTALPDERAYELVSPPNEGELYLPPTPLGQSYSATGFRAALPYRVAADGNAAAWVGEPATSVGTGETGPGEGNEWLSTRTPSGWQSSDVTPTDSAGVVFQGFSDDLSNAFVEGNGETALSGEVAASCTALYSRVSQTGVFAALFAHGIGSGGCGRPLFAGASEGEAQVIFQDEAALTPEAPPETEVPAGHEEGHQAPEEEGQPCMFGCNLYELSGGELRLVNVLDGKPVSSATFGGYAGPKALTTFSHAISDDGSRIFWTDTQAGSDMGHVYTLEDGTTTVPVSAGAAEYWTATPDGRYAFYTEDGELWRFDTDTQQRAPLTPNQYGASGTGDLAGPAAGRGTTTAGSNVITGVTTSSGTFAVGQTIEGIPGEGCGYGCIPQYDTITAVGPGTLTLAQPAGSSESNFGIATVSKEITAVNTASGHFAVGEEVFGAGIPAGSMIVSVSANTLHISSAVTAGATGEEVKAGGAEVQGVIGANETGEDGAYVYFVADGALAGQGEKTCDAEQGARNERERLEGALSETEAQVEFARIDNEEGEESEGLTPPRTGCGLYVLHAGSLSSIGALAPLDGHVSTFAGGGVEKSSDWVANVGEHIAAVTPDGTHLLIQSHRSLTGYDNRYQGNTPQLEAYVYSVADGRLACASCNPTGAAPSRAEDGTLLPESTEDADTYMRRMISENGNRVFFATSQSLAPQDANGVQDVYEWEREGEGTCTTRAASGVNGGCVFLISGGTSAIDSFPIEADATGENIFFVHVGALGQLDAPIDHNLLYDARVKGGFAKTSLSCAGTGCQGVPPGTPIFATPASVTFSGIGNFPSPPASKAKTKSKAKQLSRTQKLAKALKVCRRDRQKRRRARCERQAHSRYAAKRSARTSTGKRKASNERRTQS